MSQTIGIHGFGYDPQSPTDNPHALYDLWTKLLQTDVTGFAWYSCPPGIKSVLRAWSHGYLDRYSYAYRKLVVDAAFDLAEGIKAAGPGAHVMAHSLGSRAFLLCLALLPPGAVSRVILLDGAELQGQVPLALPDGLEVLNVCNRSDLVLRDLGSVFSGEGVDGCIGRDGLNRKMPGWHDLWIDDRDTQIRAYVKRKWHLNCVMPVDLDVDDDLRGLGGHWGCYQNKGNWPLYVSWMAGDDLKDVLGVQ